MKAYSGGRITLMTPEPDGGMYGDAGVKAFVREFGTPTGDDTLYFTGTHRADCRNEKTGLTLAVRGFNPTRNVIEDVWAVQWSCSRMQGIVRQLGHLAI